MAIAVSSSIVVEIAIDQLVKAIKRDANNEYVLHEDWSLPLLIEPLQFFENDLLLIDGKRIVVKAFGPGIADGASLFFDQFFQLDVALNSLFHDVWYVCSNEIAKKWGWTPAKVRRKGDDIFGALLTMYSEQHTTKPKTYKKVSGIIHKGPRIGGGIFTNVRRLMRLVKKFFILVLLSLTLCGCTTPEMFEPGQTLTLPNYEKTR